MGILSRIGWARELGSVDKPRALELAADGRGFSYDSGDSVSGVESGKWTPLDLTSGGTGGEKTVASPGGGGYIV